MRHPRVAPTGMIIAMLLAALSCGACATLVMTGAVNPTESAREAGELADAVRSALAANGNVDGEAISVSASGNVVTLNGTVRSAQERQEAIRTSAAVDGVGRIVDRLSVAGD